VDGLETALLVVTAVAVATLTIAVLGLLRRVTDLRLLLSGHGDVRRSSLRLVAGRQVPPLPDDPLAGDVLLVFASPGCDTCAALLGELDRVAGGGRVAVVPVDATAASLLPLAADGVEVLDDASAGVLVEDLAIDATPYVVALRDRFVLGHAHGESIASASQVQAFWADLGVRPLEEVAS
jgi:hypothetical protein